MKETASSAFIREEEIQETLAATGSPDATRVREVLAKARALAGLTLREAAALMAVDDPELLAELFAAAKEVKFRVYGRRLVLFAPLYISNLCRNECAYCAFRKGNRELKRRCLTQQEIAREASLLGEQGHRRVLLVAGESYPREGFEYVLRSVETIYNASANKGEIRRVYVNVAPLEVEDYARLVAADVSAYQIFQETYHRETYRRVHTAGPKMDYDWRVTAMHRAMQGGMEDVGIGALLGLYDWRFEVLAMMQHVADLEKNFGAGCHTISVPRIEPAIGSELAAGPPSAVSDADFIKLIAILRLAVPYAGIIMTTRESAEIRRASMEVGISMLSGGSRTDPGGYSAAAEGFESGQFALGDQRSLDEVVRDVASLGYIPSFCTACYRLGRQGQHFMELAKPGDIKLHCAPNALSTFLEYLEDFASSETRTIGEDLLASQLSTLQEPELSTALNLTRKIRAGKRDIYT